MPTPRKPVELKRRQGNPGHERLPKPVAYLDPAGQPEPVRPLDVEGTALWRRIWASGAVWLARTDVDVVQLLCETVDERQQVRAFLADDPDRMLRVQLRQLDEQVGRLLAAVGFTPSDRTRLGVAEVRPMSKLDELRAKSNYR